jgi:prepilin peptidase CpaA
MKSEIVIYLLLAVLAGAAAMDLSRLRIPNFFPLAVIGLFFVWFALSPGASGVWQNAAMFAFTLVGSTFLFTKGWLGGGDAKLMAAIALWFDFRGAASLFFYVAIGGALLSFIFIILRRMMPAHLAESSNAAAFKPRGPIPYGIAIAGGAMLAILGGAINPHPISEQTGFHYVPLPPAPSR